MIRGIASVVMFASVFGSYRPIDAQSTPRLEFDVVSIKRNTAGPEAGGGMRTLPDGTRIMTNQPIRSVINSASPVPVREVVGLPDWANVERYDLTAKPPVGSTREERLQMWQTLFADRMKLSAHVEHHERDTYSLVLARSDGRLGPQLKPSTLDCGPRPAGTPPPPPPTSSSDFTSRCGGSFGATSIVSGGITMDSLVFSLEGLAGRLVNNKTGLKGFYALTLNFAQPRVPGAAPQEPALSDELPEIFTALQEQLGLKLQPDKTTVPIFVVDHIERPREN
jgi:uncharacterized protein (TIGR03435 family)